MPIVVLLIVLAVIAFLLYKSVQDARQQAGGAAGSTSARPPSSQPPSRPRARRQRSAKPKVDEEALAAHVAKLRSAVDEGLISMDEAIASVVRQTDGAVGEDAARKLLKQDDAA